MDPRRFGRRNAHDPHGYWRGSEDQDPVKAEDAYEEFSRRSSSIGSPNVELEDTVIPSVCHPAIAADSGSMQFQFYSDVEAEERQTEFRIHDTRTSSEYMISLAIVSTEMPANLAQRGSVNLLDDQLSASANSPTREKITDLGRESW